MTLDILLSMCVFILIHGLFLLIGHRWILFSGITSSLLFLLGFFFFTPHCSADETIQHVLLLFGFLLYYIGLSLLGAMLRRSISLHALSAVLNKRSPNDVIHSGIQTRILEAFKWKVVREDEGRLYLTPFGHVIGSLMGIFYTLYRIK